MNWIAYAVTAWLAFGLELGLRDGLEIGSSGIAPSFVVVLLVVVALQAPVMTALWASFIAGLLLDLTNLVVDPASDIAHISIGPHALGCLLAGYTVVTMRALVMRRSVLTMVFLSFIAAALLGIVTTALFSIRLLYDPNLAFAPAAALGRGLASAAYTAGLSAVVGPLLMWSSPLFSFHTNDPRHRWRSI